MTEIENRRLEIVCPCCQARLRVDAETGLVLGSQAKKAGLSFEEAVQKEQARKSKTDELFNRVFLDEKERRQSLEKKFKKALKSEEELDEPPPRPWDLD